MCRRWRIHCGADVVERRAVDAERGVRHGLDRSEIVPVHVDADVVETLIVRDRPMLRPCGGHLGIPVAMYSRPTANFWSPPIISGVGGHLPGSADVDD